MKNVSWPDYQQLTTKEKKVFCNSENSPYHVLLSQQFDRAMLDRLCAIATKTRKIGKTRGGIHFLQDLLSEKRVMIYFVQPSTRTFLSFTAATQLVGMSHAHVRDTSTSSEVKGESPEDTVRTFSSYFDMIIMRHPLGGFAERIAWLLSNSDRPVPVINAGSGKDQHPTQALLDVYTLERSFEDRGGIDGKKVAFVGDLKRGRTVRSLATMLTMYQGVKQYFVAPEPLQIGSDILKSLEEAGTDFEVCYDFEKIIPEVDAIYMTRIQDEWDTGEESRTIDTEPYHFREDHLKILQEHAVLLHPLPRRNEIAPEVDFDPRAVYWRQVRNGMWIRAALMIMIFERDGEIDRYYADLTR
jgi:aspartate carbamoyltransferase catalytic subunit